MPYQPPDRDAFVGVDPGVFSRAPYSNERHYRSQIQLLTLHERVGSNDSTRPAITYSKTTRCFNQCDFGEKIDCDSCV